MQAAETPRSPTGAPAPELVRAAFRGVHGRRLHGFALLLTLGDRPRAARATAGALADATERTGELRHPERAAAWLRARVLRRARAAHDRPPQSRPDLRVLDELGVDGPVLDALGVIDMPERAAIIASDIERLDLRDVATVVGMDGPRLGRMLNRARSRYADAFIEAVDDGPSDGPLVTRIRAVADQALR